MDAETIKWLTTIIIGNVVFWSVVMGILKTLLGRAKHTEEKTDKIIHMHLNADDYGFGTVKLAKSFEANERHGRELVHYMKWFVKETTGKDPEPFIDEHH